MHVCLTVLGLAFLPAEPYVCLAETTLVLEQSVAWAMRNVVGLISSRHAAKPHRPRLKLAPFHRQAPKALY
jgi:hypothetical protein